MGKARNIADLLNSSGKIDSADIDSSAQFYQFKNRIINGAMMIDQRNAGASVTQTGDFRYPVDRFIIYGDPTSKFTAQQNAGSVTPPAGFTNYLGITSSSSYSVGSSDVFITGQQIEGLNCADLGWGTANAATVTLSFRVRSSLTGTFGGSLRNSAGNRSYPFTYTISSANTWTTVSVTIAGDTTGTWLTTNGTGIQVWFGLGVGSTSSGTAGSWAGASYFSATGATSVVGTNGATFYITGVQLEKGSTATSFDYRPYGTELALCQRYCFANRASTSAGNYLRYGLGENDTVGNMNLFVQYPVTMRATPSITTTGTPSNYGVYSAAVVRALTAGPTIGSDTNQISATVSCNTAGGLTIGGAGSLLSNNNGISFLIYSAEL